MKKFNLNDHILVNPTEYGVKEAIKAVGEDYWKHCVLPHRKIIDGCVYYKIQAHQIITLWGNALWIGSSSPIGMTILIP